MRHQKNSIGLKADAEGFDTLADLSLKARLTPQCSADRTVREYTEKYYLPAASAYLKRARERGAPAARLLGWQRAMAHNWAGVRFGPLRAEINDGHHLIQLRVDLGGLPPTTRPGSSRTTPARSSRSKRHRYCGSVKRHEPFCH